MGNESVGTRSRERTCTALLRYTRVPGAHTHPTDTPPSHQARRCSCSSIGAPARAHLPQRHRLHLRHVLHARTRGRCKKTLVIQNSHTFLIVSAGKTPPTCDEIVDLRHSACGHNQYWSNIRRIYNKLPLVNVAFTPKIYVAPATRCELSSKHTVSGGQSIPQMGVVILYNELGKYTLLPVHTSSTIVVVWSGLPSCVPVHVLV